MKTFFAVTGLLGMVIMVAGLIAVFGSVWRLAAVHLSPEVCYLVHAGEVVAAGMIALLYGSNGLRRADADEMRK